MPRFVRGGPVDGTIRGLIRCRGEDRCRALQLRRHPPRKSRATQTSTE
ncbi:unnamed protein product [Ectocarpus sp. 6 AP-2014]